MGSPDSGAPEEVVDVVVSSVSKVNGGVGGGAFFGIGAEGLTLRGWGGNPRCVVTGEADRLLGLDGERASISVAPEATWLQPLPFVAELDRGDVVPSPTRPRTSRTSHRT